MASAFEGLIDTMIGQQMSAFGEPAVYTEPGHMPQQITGVFDRAYLELFPMGGANGQEGMQLGAAGNVTTRRPMLGVQMSQFRPGHPPVQGATVRLPGRVTRDDPALYSVKEVRPDGHGGARLLLIKA